MLSKAALKQKNYPDEPSGDFYLVFDVKPAPDFNDYSWDYSKLPNRPAGRQSATPFAVTLDAVLDTAYS